MKRVLAIFALSIVFVVLSVTSVSAGSNCTLTIGFWKTHPNAWMTDTLTLGGQTYTKTQVLNILETEPLGDATFILGHQLIAAELNIANGANNTAISDTLTAANAWLDANPLGSKPGEPSRTVGISLSLTLTNYNEGNIGPGHCPPTSVTLTNISAAPSQNSLLLAILLLLTLVVGIIVRRYR